MLIRPALQATPPWHHWAGRRVLYIFPEPNHRQSSRITTATVVGASSRDDNHSSIPGRNPRRGFRAHRFATAHLQMPTLGRIIIRHPGYAEDDMPLLVFYGLDDATGGLYHNIARTACAIVADNRFDGYISTSPRPRQPNADANSSATILAGGNY
ncbi:hypothetical protein SCARD494_14142 [Seiridium cardinale]